MKRLFIRLSILGIVVIFLDFVVGIVGTMLVNNAKGGDTKRKTHISRNVDSKVLIFGSSRAIHHYDPDILENTLV